MDVRDGLSCRLEMQLPQLQYFASEIMEATESDLVTIRRVTATKTDDRAYLLAFASQDDTTPAKEKSLACYGEHNPRSNIGADHGPDSAQISDEADKRLYERISQRAAFPLAIDGEETLLVSLLRFKDGVSGLANRPYGHPEVVNAWVNCQHALSSRFLINSPLHRTFVEAISHVRDLRETDDQDLFLFGIAKCLSSANGFLWNRVFIFQASDDSIRDDVDPEKESIKTCRVAMGHTYGESWKAAVSSKPNTLRDELLFSVGSGQSYEEVLQIEEDGLAKSCLSDPVFKFEAPIASPSRRDDVPFGWISLLNSELVGGQFDSELKRKCEALGLPFDACGQSKTQCFVIGKIPYLLVVSDSYGKPQKIGNDMAARTILTSAFVKHCATVATEMLRRHYDLEQELGLECETCPREQYLPNEADDLPNEADD